MTLRTVEDVEKIFTRVSEQPRSAVVIGGLTQRQAKICKKKKACNAKIDKRNTEMK